MNCDPARGLGRAHALKQHALKHAAIAAPLKQQGHGYPPPTAVTNTHTHTYTHTRSGMNSDPPSSSQQRVAGKGRKGGEEEVACNCNGTAPHPSRLRSTRRCFWRAEGGASPSGTETAGVGGSPITVACHPLLPSFFLFPPPTADWSLQDHSSSQTSPPKASPQVAEAVDLVASRFAPRRSRQRWRRHCDEDAAYGWQPDLLPNQSATW
ncbi:hypothetical protein E2320_014457 [Naja naja]|nr:hypothetical protein E2320_014457 [Naja naja]